MACASLLFVLFLRTERRPAEDQPGLRFVAEFPNHGSCHESTIRAVERFVVTVGPQPQESSEGEAEPRIPSASGSADSFPGIVAAVGRKASGRQTQTL